MDALTPSGDVLDSTRFYSNSPSPSHSSPSTADDGILEESDYEEENQHYSSAPSFTIDSYDINDIAASPGRAAKHQSHAFTMTRSLRSSKRTPSISENSTNPGSSQSATASIAASSSMAPEGTPNDSQAPSGPQTRKSGRPKTPTSAAHPNSAPVRKSNRKTVVPKIEDTETSETTDSRATSSLAEDPVDELVSRGTRRSTAASENPLTASATTGRKTRSVKAVPGATDDSIVSMANGKSIVPLKRQPARSRGRAQESMTNDGPSTSTSAEPEASSILLGKRKLTDSEGSISVTGSTEHKDSPKTSGVGLEDEHQDKKRRAGSPNLLEIPVMKDAPTPEVEGEAAANPETTVEVVVPKRRGRPRLGAPKAVKIKAPGRPKAPSRQSSVIGSKIVKKGRRGGPGRRKKSKNLLVEAAYERQLDLRVAYRDVMRLVKTGLDVIAKKSAKMMHADGHYHEKQPEYKQTLAALDAKRQERYKRLDEYHVTRLEIHKQDLVAGVAAANNQFRVCMILRIQVTC